MPFTFTPTDLPNVVLIEARAFGDARGFFLEAYKRSAFVAAGIDAHFVQENRSGSARGVLRGLHYQAAPYGQGKLVSVVAGEIFDVAVDVRPGAPTFGKYVSFTLSESNHRSLYIPPWCAHGFCVLSERAEVAYKTTAEYAPEHERGIRWDDPAIGIKWPMTDVTLSERDRQLPSIAAAAGRQG
jgi:dTDP-4-dehydrorhamnose 3,5-epimerase